MSRTGADDAARARCRRSSLVALVVLLVGAVGWVGAPHTTAAAPAELISVAPQSGAPLNGYNYTPSISGDGSIVVFTASGTVSTVYVRNRVAHTTTAVPLPALVTQTEAGAVSRDGCHVAFWGLYNSFFIPPQWNIYTWDRCTAGSVPIPVSASTGLGASGYGYLSVSADGRYVAYYTSPGGAVTPRVAWIDTTTLAESSLPSGMSYVSRIDISDDGKFVALGGQLAGSSEGRVIGWQPPCIVGAAVVCKTEVVSLTTAGQPASGYSIDPSVSADGRYVAFSSSSPDLPAGTPSSSAQIYVRDRVAGITKLITDTPGQPMSGGNSNAEPDITPDGTQIAFSEQTGGEISNVYVVRSTSGYFDSAALDLVSYGVSGNPVSDVSGAGNPVISSNGRFVAFGSQANLELSGGTVPNDYTHVWLRDRPVALDITPTVDFGSVLLGAQSTPRSVTVTNTSGVAINISSVVPPAAPFFVTANTCGGVIQPGATCAVTLVFRPSAPGSASSTVTVSGDGLSVSSALVGNGRGLGALSITPTSANYGNAVIGTVIAPKNFVVTNTGQAPVGLTPVTLAGTGSDQFAIASNGCTGSLAPAGSCTIAVGATVTRGGSSSATLRVAGVGGELAQATLRLGGDLFTPTLKMNPGVVSAGEVTVAIGEGFPPNIDVQLAFDGELQPLATVHTDAAGAFRFDFLVLRNGTRIGGRQVIAVDQPTFSDVKAPLLIDLATYRPSGFEQASFASTVRSMYTRGG